jgi:hypothetical protein
MNIQSVFEPSKIGVLKTAIPMIGLGSTALLRKEEEQPKVQSHNTNNAVAVPGKIGAVKTLLPVEGDCGDRVESPLSDVEGDGDSQYRPRKLARGAVEAYNRTLKGERRPL